MARTSILMTRFLCVLIVGMLGATTIATAQSSGTFAPTSSMTTARSLHTATLLPNGQVLLAGGASSSDRALSSAELYDTGSGTFRSAGTMTTARRLHSATLLPDGRVLIAGGDRDGGALASAELFDPVTGIFSPTGSLRIARSGHTAILLATGNVLVVGGYGTRAYPEVAPAEIYDSMSGTFSAADAYVG